MNEPSKDVGSILKQEREKQGISLESVHEATKIPIDSLKAIEEGYKVRTLTTFYYRSFVRIYSQYLDMDPESLLAQLSDEYSSKRSESQFLATSKTRPVAAQRPKPVKPQPRPETAKPKPVKPSPEPIKLPTITIDWKRLIPVFKSLGLLVVAAAAVAAVVFLALGVIKKIRSYVPPPRPVVVTEEKKPLKKTKPQAAPIPSEPVKKLEEKKHPEGVKAVEPVRPVEPPAKTAEAPKMSLLPKKIEPVKKVEPAPKPVEPASTPEPKPVPVENKPLDNREAKAEAKESKTEKAAPVPAVAKASKVSVSVRAMNNAWLNVRADGSQVFQGILKKGSFNSWSASKSIDISGKDINQLEFEVNGRSIGRLSRKGASAKKIRITPEGLDVEK